MLEKDLLRAVLDAALARGGDFAEVFVEQKRVAGISLEAGRIERVSSGLDVGAGLRLVRDGHTAYAYTNDLSRAGLLEAARLVASAAGSASPGRSLDLRRVEPLVDFPIAEPPDRAPMEDKVEMVRQADEAARSVDGRVKQVSVSYGDVRQDVIIANSEGVFVEDRRVRVRLAVQAVAMADGVMQTGYEAAGGVAGLELLRREGPAQLGARAARRAVLMLTARPAPAGRMPVVLAGEAGGTMVHEACGHGLEADLVQKSLSVYAGRLGERVAAPVVTIIDDGTLPGRYGSFRFDDEGTPAARTVLIRDGVLEGYMYDRLTARRDAAALTGNGRRESYQDRPIPRMTNTYLQPGREEPREVIRAAGRGLLVKKMGGGQVNTTTGDFVFEVAEGYLIENGEAMVPVRGATLTGNGPEALQNIVLVGKDLGFAIGTCGKDGQGVPVSDAQPTIFVRELVVGGIAGDR